MTLAPPRHGTAGPGAGGAEAAGVRERGAERGAAGRAEPQHLAAARAGLPGAPRARRHDRLLLRRGAAGRRLGRATPLQAGHGLPSRVGHGRPPARPPPAPRRLPMRVRRAAGHRPRVRPQPHRRGRGGRRAGSQGRPGEPAAARARRRAGGSPPRAGGRSRGRSGPERVRLCRRSQCWAPPPRSREEARST